MLKDSWHNAFVLNGAGNVVIDFIDGGAQTGVPTSDLDTLISECVDPSTGKIRMIFTV